MENQPTDEMISAVAAFIADNPGCSASQIPGDPELVLLALRRLNWSGRLKGIIQADYTRIGNDEDGPYIAEAIGLELA